ncbi:MAG TPA: dihydropteroate synthase [Cyclobacteriaceae bacterium]
MDFIKKKTISIKGGLISFQTPKVMGVINLTPDSFYSKSRLVTEKEILSTAEKMLEDGADILDVGGYSSRPGADDVPIEEEVERIKPIELIKNKFPQAIISIDTFRVPVAKVALSLGADIVNDISGGDLDDGMFEFISKIKVPYILMHMKGKPQNMKSLAQYDDLLKELFVYFKYKIDQLKADGVKDIIIDPGFGFAKSIADNFQLLNNLEMLSFLDTPVLVGLSRKSMIYKTLKIEAENSLFGTVSLNTIAILKQADILRVHDVKEAVQIINLTNCLKD